MATASHTLILKVLSGSQFGVEVGLPDGEYTFGNGDEADIRFTDLSMAATHGALRIASGKVEIRAVGAGLATSSGLVIEPGAEDWREIAQLDKITAGTSVFAIATPDAKWSSLTAVTSVESATAPVAGSNGGSRVTAVVTALAVVAACVFGILYLTGGNSSLPRIQRTSPTEDLTLVQQALNKLPFDNRLTVEMEADGVVNVSGYVETGTERRAVQNALVETGAPVRRRIWALEAIRSDVDGLIQSQNLDIDHSIGADGVLKLSGISLDKTPVDDAVTLLETQVFGLAGIDNKIRTAEDFLAEVEALIDRVQLTDLVLARLDGLLIETNGVVPLDKTDNWVGFVRAYSRQYAPILPLRSFVTLEGQPRDIPTQPIIISGDNTVPGAIGRVLSPAALADEAADAGVLFAQPDASAGAEASAPSAATAISLAGLVSGLTSPSQAEIENLVNGFAAENPQVVAALLETLTNGQVSSVDELRTVFSDDGTQAGDTPGETTAPRIVRTPGGDAFVDFFNDALSRTGAQAADGTALNLPSNGFVLAPGRADLLGSALRQGNLVPTGLISATVSGSNDTEIEGDTVPGPDRAAATDLAASDPTDAQAVALAGNTPGASNVAGPGQSPVPALAELQTPTEGGAPLTDTPGALTINRDTSESRGDTPSPAPATRTATDDPQTEDAMPRMALVQANGQTYLASETAYRPDLAIRRMDAATSLLFVENADGTVSIDADALRLKPELALVSRELIDLTMAQSRALAQGVTLLAAQPIDREIFAGACWIRSNITVEGLPIVLLWLDILSVSTDIDVNQIAEENRLLFMEAALNPARLVDCLERIDTDFSLALLDNSAFLKESARNDTFSEFLFRNVGEYPLDLIGISLIEDRYIQLTDGRKLREGSAPEIDSRVAVIGDLGVLIRIPSGFEVQLYQDSISWRVAAN